MGMAVDHLLRHAVHHVGHREAAPLLLNGGMKHHLHQNVAQLLLHIHGVVPVQGVQGLAGLLQEVAPNGLMGLLGVPGTAAGPPQKPHNLKEIVPAIAGLILKIYHTLPAFARSFVCKQLEISGFFILSAEV